MIGTGCAWWGYATASSVGMPSNVKPCARAKPLAAASPTRSPVNEPGPSATATARKPLGCTPACASICAIAGISSSVWRLAECQLYSATSPRTPS